VIVVLNKSMNCAKVKVLSLMSMINKFNTGFKTTI
jgi:hypothetical protein